MSDTNQAGVEVPPPPLRLKALDLEDLAVLSAHVQDATVKVGDMAYLPKLRRFVLIGARFDWPLARHGDFQRCVTGVHFDCVTKVMRFGFDQDPDRMLDLMAIVFLPGPAPSGTVILSFAGGAAVRLEVECLEVALGDVGPRWSVDGQPGAAGSER